MSLNYTAALLEPSYILLEYPKSSKISIWMQLAITIFAGIIVHYIMLRRCPHNLEDKLKYQLPPQVSLIGCLVRASYKTPMDFICSARSVFWQPHPVLIRILGKEVYILQDRVSITAMLKEKSLSAIPLAAYLMRHAFKMPPRVVKLHYDPCRPVEDNATPMYDKIREINRRFLTSRESSGFFNRFQKDLQARIKSTNQQMSTTSWTHWEDFATFFRDDLTTVVLDALYGLNLLQLNPDFVVHFWEFNDNLASLLTPDWSPFGSRKSVAREELLLAIERWQTAAAMNFASDMSEMHETERSWGSSFFRERYIIMQGLEGYDAKSMASQELAFLYALNSNAIPATLWTALEVFKDPELLRIIRKEVSSCAIPGKELEFDLKLLLSRPILQAVYAETLRLRGHGLFVRQAHEDVNLNGWTLRKNGIALASSTPAHMNPDVWCSDRSASDPPVDHFAPGRFLKSRGDSLEFDISSYEGFWLPFGGGSNPCPGKQFAKLQAFLTVALLVSMVDCVVLVQESKLTMSMGSFGIGVLNPAEKIPVCVRPRHNI